MSDYENNKQLYRDFIACTLGEDLGKLDEYLAADYRSHAHEGLPPGPEAERQQLLAFRGAFPDFNLEIEHLLADDSYVARVAKVSGTQDGEFIGAPPSGKRFEARVADIMRVEDGRLSEHWTVFDSSAMMAQLGLSAGRDAAADNAGPDLTELYRGYLASLMSPELDGLEKYLPDERADLIENANRRS